jgi:hypothetical protein
VARAIAIFFELVILAGLVFSLLWAVRLALFDLWLGPKYRPAVTMALATIGGLAMIFLIVHLISFYPS